MNENEKSQIIQYVEIIGVAIMAIASLFAFVRNSIKNRKGKTTKEFRKNLKKKMDTYSRLKQFLEIVDIENVAAVKKQLLKFQKSFDYSDIHQDLIEPLHDFTNYLNDKSKESRVEDILELCRTHMKEINNALMNDEIDTYFETLV